jgi:hypothetical protein
MRDIEAELVDAENAIDLPNNSTVTPPVVEEAPIRRTSIRKSVNIQQAIETAMKSNLNLQTLDERLRHSKENLEANLSSKNVLEELNRKDSFLSNSI